MRRTISFTASAISGSCVATAAATCWSSRFINVTISRALSASIDSESGLRCSVVK
jgi:hypothetical protein